MKRLNRKGFTLVELLAVIVILSIVVGITLVTILPTLKDSRQKAFQTSAESAADFLEKQYQLSLVGDITGQTLATVPTAETSITADDFRKAGLNPTNYDLSGCTWYVDSSTGRACVKLKSATSGDYYPIDDMEVQSAGCPE